MPEPADRRRSRAARPFPAGRLLVLTVVSAFPVLLGGAVSPASAQAAVPGYGAPVTKCTITDPRLPELSGLATAGNGLLAMDDGGDQVQVFVLDGSCRVVDVRTAPVDPYDPEDLALAADGTVWLEDAGDNREDRATVAMIGLHPHGRTTVTRMTYPDGPHDTEALLLAPDGTPYLVTKEVLGASSVYRPDKPLSDGVTIPLRKVADLGFTPTGTSGGPVGRAGQLLVTGGAVAGDGSLLALRTYTDAYVWPLHGSDVVTALKSRPERIPLPASPQGEAIAFAANDRDLVVSGEGLPAVVTVLPARAPAKAAATAASGTASGSAAAGAGAPADQGPSGRASAVAAAVIAAAVATLVVWLGGKLRRRRSDPPKA